MLIIFAIFVAFMNIFSLLVDRDIRHSLRDLSERQCPSCGIQYGRIVTTQARHEYIAGCAKTRRENPTLKINFARLWRVACPACSAQSDYDFETNHLRADH